MAWLDALRAASGETAGLALLAGAAMAVVSPGRFVVAIGVTVSVTAAALCGDAAWRADAETAPAALLTACAALCAIALIATLGPDADHRRRAVRGGVALLAGAGLVFGAATPDPAFAVLGLWLAGLAGVGLIALSPAPDAAQDASRWLGFVALTCGLALLGSALQGLAGSGRLAMLGWTLQNVGLLGFAGLAPFNGLHVRLAGYGGPGAILAVVGGPAVAIGLALRGLADGPAALSGPGVGAAAVFAAGFAALHMILAVDLRRALAGLIAAQVSVCLAAAAVAIVSGARAGAEAAGLALMALALGGVAGFCALDALSPQRIAGPNDVRGSAAQAPVAAVALAIGLVGFMGAPLTFAFLGRWLTLGAALQQGWALGAMAVVMTALAAAVLGARWLALIFARVEPGSATLGAVQSSPWPAMAAVLAAGLSMVFGLAADWPLGLADLAFADLTHGGAR